MEKKIVTKEVISELYRNSSLKTLSENDDFRQLQFDASSELCVDINIELNNSIFCKKGKNEEEKIKQEMKVSKNVDFFQEKIHAEQDETSSLDGENKKNLR